MYTYTVYTYDTSIVELGNDAIHGTKAKLEAKISKTKGALNKVD